MLDSDHPNSISFGRINQLLSGANIMNSQQTFILFGVAALFAMSGCEPVETDDEPAPIEYVTLNVSAAAEGEGGSVVMTSAECTSDPDTGFFEGVFTGSDGSSLTVKMKGFTTTPGSYTCSQAADNASGEVGNKFDGCAITLSIPDPDTSVNTYAMHRDSATEKDFTYAGECAITTTYEEPRVTATVVCTGLVQTYLQGAPRNPINPEVTADIASGSSFFCDI